MAGSVNKVILIGNLGKDPELKEGTNGQFVIFSIATNHYSKQEDKDIPEWHNIVCYKDHIVTFVSQYIKKGNKVYVEGELKTRKWEKDGITRYSTDVRAYKIESLSSKSERENQDTLNDIPFGDFPDSDATDSWKQG
jgi:single-strand DNA-binding protein